MSTLRKCLKNPGWYLAVLVLGFALLAVDATREPKRQISARAYIGLVREYQEHAHPVLEGRVRCRYDPTCSEYSIGAVREYGIARGLVMTVQRLSRCRRDVPLGTNDPVPLKVESRQPQADLRLSKD